MPTGLRPVWDDRSRDYPVRALLEAGAQRKTTDWVLQIYLDQLQEGACVGFTGAEEAAAEPVAVRGVDDAFGRRIYKECQKVDEWEGENYEGTSMTALGKVMKAMGLWLEYRWAFGIDDVIDSLVQIGPVAFGGPWYPSMNTPTPEGRMIISGSAASGHAITGRLYDHERGRIRIRNHWLRKADGKGSHWGDNGEAWMPLEDWDKWLRSGGQCMVPIMRGDPSAPPPVPPAPAETKRERIHREFVEEFGTIDHMNHEIVFRKEPKLRWPVRGNAP